ncbi:MAG: malto-oligosyltrehalose synthase [Spirochaetaceae bacterium]|nr:MAG: malto-oligosyltrehalose synthase [Spirochaetaceae bacterium]
MSCLPPYPRATYRLQLSSLFTFDDAAEIIPYLSRLGVSHVYASPILTARAGSTHGYDIVDHNRLNPEFGGEAGFARLVDTLHRNEMGLIIDFVPNHMGVGYSDNAWWLNVLEWGRSSPYASFFDIDWSPSEQSLRGKVLLPVLGAQYGTVLENGELSLAFDRDSGSFAVHYYEHRFPVSPAQYTSVLDTVLPVDAAPRATISELQEIGRAFRSLGTGAKSARRMALTIRRSDELRARLSDTVTHQPDVAAAIDRACESIDVDFLHGLLERQSYRLGYWRLAANEINYRRFFDINDLAAIRMESPEVFEITHQLVFSLIADGSIQGIRLDHIDGLLDPSAYLSRFQEAAAYRLLEARDRPQTKLRVSLDQPFYVLVEKILAHHEKLRDNWEVSGTTGYDFMRDIGELFTDPAGEEPLTQTYERFIGRPREFPETVLNAKYRTMHDTLASELNVLANRMSRLAKSSRRTRDFSRLAIRSALMDIVARFPVYRSYADSHGVSDEGRRDIEWAVATAKKACRTVDTTPYDFVQAILTTDLVKQYPGEFRRREVVDLAMKVQQFTAPVMAKSFEDTAFYRDGRFIARNEVGADPDRFYCSPQAFHYGNRDRLKTHPFAMVTTATHDHKRGEDTRARLYVISEIAPEWGEWVGKTAEFTASGDGAESDQPTQDDRYIVFQTLVGTWPLTMRAPDYDGIDDYTERIVAYAIKSAREAKIETSWTAPNQEYEKALERYVRSVLNPQRSATILRRLEKFALGLAPVGAVNSIAQKLLTLTVPGVPDVYQGTTGWDFSLVDPDNRRSVDFAAHAQLLDSLVFTPRGCRDALARWIDAVPKHMVVAAALRVRRRLPDVFAAGEYIPLETSGRHAERIVAFARSLDGVSVVTVAPRLVEPLVTRTGEPLPEGWDDTRIDLTALSARGIPDERWIDEFTGRELDAESNAPRNAEDTAQAGRALTVAAVLEHFPAALLVSLSSQR